MNKRWEAEYLKELVYAGYSFEYGRICICCINQYYKGRLDGVKFQVHCDHHKLPKTVSELFDKLDAAVDRFLGLKILCYGERK